MPYTTLNLIDPDGLCFTFSFDYDVDDEKADQLHERFQELLAEALEQIAMLCDMTVQGVVLPSNTEMAYYKQKAALAEDLLARTQAERDQYRAEATRLIHLLDQCERPGGEDY